MVPDPSASPKGVTISGTFHGSRIEVTHVHTVDGWDDDELARMEAALAGLPEGAVVSHPTGSHLSHHAGQAQHALHRRSRLRRPALDPAAPASYVLTRLPTSLSSTMYDYVMTSLLATRRA